MELLTVGEAAKYLGLSPKTLANKRWRGNGPAFYKIGGGNLVRYAVEDLDSWALGNRYRSTSEVKEAAQ